MQGKIVATGGQVKVIRILAPLYPHAKQVYVKTFAGFQFAHVERDVAHSKGGWPLH